MATLHVDGNSYTVDDTDNLLQACLSLGLDVPYFCWHPAMGSVGACRQCAVKRYKDKDDDQGMLVMSCMTPAADDTYISIDDSEAVEFRAKVIEWLMINHPHDCPVCEEGGHCHLQDMTVMTAHHSRRYRFGKRTHRNQYLGPFIGHEMNRCISCYRCVRFYQDYAGGDDLGVFGANDNLYFGRHQDGVLESVFSGNLTEVCPTGVFTDQTHSDRYTRKWDLQFAPSVCHQCAVGCNTSPGERYGEIRRIENRYNGDVNRYFLCDRGRFGYGYVNRKDRPVRPEWRDEPTASAVALDVDTTLTRSAERLRSARRIIGIGSPRASLESNHQLKRLVGDNQFSTGIGAVELECLALMNQLNRTSGLTTPTPREIEDHDAVLVLGEDLINSAARLGLSVRQAVLGRRDELAEARDIPVWDAAAVKTLAQDARHPLITAYPTRTGLDDIAREHHTLAVDDIARLGFAIAHAIDPEAPVVEGLDEALAADAKTIADTLIAAKRPLLVSGGSLESRAILDATGNIARALAKHNSEAGLTLIRREANSTGLAMLGGHSLDWALTELCEQRADAVVILENDLYQRAAAQWVDRALEQTDTLVVLDHQRTATGDKATLILPAASFAEGDGTLVSLEGRAQRFFQVYDPRYHRPETHIHESWRWLHAMRATLKEAPVTDITLDAVTADCADQNPELAEIVNASQGADARVEGVKFAREPHRYSGRTAMRSHLGVNEPRTPQDPDTAFTFSMEGYSGFDRPRQDVAFAWAPGWNSPQAWNKFTDEIGGHLSAGDPGVRLLKPESRELPYSQVIPAAYRATEQEWQTVVLPRLFGGEETSSRAQPIADRALPPTFGLATADASQLSVSDQLLLTLSVDGQRLTLPVSIDDSLPAGLVTVPAGCMPGLSTGTRVELQAEPDQEVS
ncbi:MAG TPA: NADH-quinone oxidoreductase subunit NuoG [Saccharospirillum sp.]|nr:NADH-quinone oxidoreductase subunit NuoG [Saccharospirillum sp.]